MLKRIQEITNIGKFSATKPASIEFTNLVYIYGPNSQGKTTLCDIFKSIMSSDPAYIVERKTVGGSTKQSVTLNFGNHNELIFKDNHWLKNGTIPESDNLMVFDTEFVHKNVFTNSQIEHQNKENFTHFVIGNDSVQLSLDLQELNRQKRDINDRIKSLESDVTNALNGKCDLTEFKKIKFLDDTHDCDVACFTIQNVIKRENDNKNNINSIKNMQMPKVLSSFNTNFVSNYIRINNVLSSSIQFDSNTLMEKYEKHKKEHINKIPSNNTDIWLAHGTEMIKDCRCPYCGADLNNNDLVKSYIELFSNEVKKYKDDIDWLKKFKANIPINLTDGVLENSKTIEKLNGKIFDTQLQTIYQNLSSESDNLINVIRTFNKNLSTINEDIELKTKLKLDNIYDSVDMVDLKPLLSSISELNNLVKNYNESIEKYAQLAKEYIDNLSIDKIDKHLKELKKEFDVNQLFILRNQFNDKLVEIENNEKEAEKITSSIKQKKSDFDITQENYLKAFFSDINKYFNQLGSRNFTIEKQINTRGTNKTYSLDLKFNNMPIPTDKIQYFLSESDRRALALSIFFAKLSKTANKDTIIVLDDPITSFDLERMNVFINKLKELKGIVSQIIITTHYQSFFRKLVSLTKKDVPTLIKIQSDTTSNCLIKLPEKSELLMDEYEKALFEMTSFMKGTTHNYSEVSARTILQKYIEYHFAYELIDVHYQDLDSLLKIIKEKGLIDNSLFTKLNNKREEYNDPAHQFDNDQEDQKRNSINELYEILKELK